MALTGRADGPALGPPDRLVGALDTVAAGVVAGDPLVLLGERAALGGLTRRSPVSCGGASQLVPCADGWIAISLARATDVELVPAWLELDRPVDDTAATDRPIDEVWAVIRREVADRPAAVLHERAALLGLPAAVMGADAHVEPIDRSRGAADRPPRSADGALVVDLSSLWAGPLCGQVLATHGARVVKVESSGRPDGARRGEPAFFDLLNGTKRSVALDLDHPGGIAALGALLARADVVIEASRPRALAHLGFGAEALLDAGWTGVWTSITGYGRTGAAATRVAFGDDAATAGGLLVHEGDEPLFCADAVADPLTGLTAAAATLDAMATSGSWLVDVRMAGVAASAAGPTVAVPDTVVPARPRARPLTTTAPPLGADTTSVLADLGIEP